MARVARLAPEGLGVMTGGAEPFSVLTDQLLGVETLSLLLYENPALVRHLADRVGQIVLDMVELTTALPFIDGYVLGGDLGYKTATVVSPAVLRELIFPWYRRFVDAAHRHGKIILLHSCGNLAQVMDDIVACGFDGKHSFEDAITPGLAELHARYGGRLALIGGVDVDFLCRASEAQIRQRVRDTIDRMAPGGGYILGSGNSIPEYCPVESFWAMLDEGLMYGR
jgi:uroporphyrinogen decarboxylase